MIMLRRVGISAVGIGGSVLLGRCAHSESMRDEQSNNSDAVAQLQRQAEKARRRAQERVHVSDQEMLGMTPKLWLEALDEQHRYGSILYPYWQRWEASRTRWMFFDWLDRGRGSLIDLPACPRRLLDEARVLYMSHEQLALCEVRIQGGLLVWAADDEPVTLPAPRDAAVTPRSRAIAQLEEEGLATTRRREGLLRECRADVMRAVSEGQPAEVEALARVTKHLVEQEGLLRVLRDPCFHERSYAHRLTLSPTPCFHERSYAHPA